MFTTWFFPLILFVVDNTSFYMKNEILYLLLDLHIKNKIELSNVSYLILLLPKIPYLFIFISIIETILIIIYIIIITYQNKKEKYLYKYNDCYSEKLQHVLFDLNSTDKKTLIICIIYVFKKLIVVISLSDLAIAIYYGLKLEIIKIIIVIFHLLISYYISRNGNSIIGQIIK